MADIWNNDAVVQFLIDNGFPSNYMDGVLAYLRELYSSNASFADLLARYIRENGTTLNALGNFLASEDGVTFETETGVFFIVEEALSPSNVFNLEDLSGFLLLEDDSYLLQEA